MTPPVPAPFPYTLPECLESCLRGLGHFIYYPNPGNLGDELIAVATVQVFERLGLSFEMYEEGRSYAPGYTLVHGGGGGMVPEWGCLEGLIRLFSEPGLARCVVLPHSMRGCPELLEVMDERFTVFLREQASYDYVTSLNHRAHFHQAHDMAFYLDLKSMPERSALLAAMPRPGLLRTWFAMLRGADKNTDHTLLLARFYRKTFHRMEKRLPGCLQTLPDGRRIACFMRRDQEQQEGIRELFPSLDLSRLGGSKCLWPEFNTLGVAQFFHAISQADIIVSDRLHVSIASAILGRHVVMLDNNYGKLSGIYQYSMTELPHVLFCRTVEEATRALEQLSHS